MLPPRHVPYVPNPRYELLERTGLLRYPACVRETVKVILPPQVLAWLPFIAGSHVRTRAILPYLTTN